MSNNVADINWSLGDLDLILSIQKAISAGENVVSKGEKSYERLHLLSQTDCFVESGLEIKSFHCPRELQVVAKEKENVTVF